MNKKEEVTCLLGLDVFSEILLLFNIWSRGDVMLGIYWIRKIIVEIVIVMNTFFFV